MYTEMDDSAVASVSPPLTLCTSLNVSLCVRWCVCATCLTERMAAMAQADEDDGPDGLDDEEDATGEPDAEDCKQQ
eukprot:SAG31_NODE_441_length_15661_cov_17.905423_22_plen_76_part_00